MNKNFKRFFTVSTLLTALIAVWATTFTSDGVFADLAAKANGYYLEISTQDSLIENWTDTARINADNDWTQVIAIEGFRGEGLAPVPGTDPRTITADAAGSPSVFANQTNPATSTADGVAEFEIANPTIALKGSDSAQAPNIVVHINSLQGCLGKAVNVNFRSRDIDASANDAISPLAVQYRIGGTGNYTNVAFGYLPDTTSGPNQANQENVLNATLPNAASGVAMLDIRFITTNAVGADEWIGIDDIDINCHRTSHGAGSISGFAATAKGAGIMGATVTAINTRTLKETTAVTNASGDFVLTDLEVGDLYTVTIRHRQFKFAGEPQVVQLLEDATGLQFTAEKGKASLWINKNDF